MAVALCAINGQPLHIYNIRQNRPQPGLKPQHLEAVLTAAKLCSAELKGAKVDSRELWFNPNEVKGGNVEAEIGTAGSISMLLITVLPICTFAENIVHLHISKGGTDVSHSPTINYMRFVLLPSLQQMGLKAVLTIQRYGYFPRGNGEITISITPCKSLKALTLQAFGKIKSIKGVSVCTFLGDRKVAERQAIAANVYLGEKGYNANVQIINDASNAMQKGSSLVLWAETDTKAILGADAIGELRKTSETVGTEAAERLYSEIIARPTVDTHLADLLIPYMALAQGKSTYLTRTLTEHLQTNLWLAEKILNVKFSVEMRGKLYRIEKVG
jgi:RNA 3'-phosphate cyclase